MCTLCNYTDNAGWTRNDPPNGLGTWLVVANVAYIAWYVGIGRQFWRAARRPPAWTLIRAAS